MADHVEVLQRMLAEEDVMSEEADDAMRAAIAALEAVQHLAANAYDHHISHMTCVPTDEWKIAMNRIPADVFGEQP